MKNLNKIFTIAIAAAFVSSCADLDTQYFGQYVTTEQKEAALESNPDLADAAVSAVFSQFGSLFGQTFDQHFDFGYPALMIGLDSQTADFHSRYSGGNHFRYWEGFLSPTSTGTPTRMTWRETYKQIKTCNSLIATISEDTDVPELQFSLAQGLAVRAFDYWLLAQLYQFNYVGHEQSPCVPIITDLNEAAAANEGAPRATVQEVYDQILKDLDTAIALIEKSGKTPASMSDNKPKRLVSLAVAYGLRARVYLTMHKYAEAAADAQSAINSFSGRPYNMSEVSTPGFNNSDDASWMWSIVVASTDRPTTTGICNWPSMMGSFSYGYVTIGAWRWCSKTLYESIPASDVRKGWWLDENYKSDHLSSSQQAYLDDYLDPENAVPALSSQTSFLMPYTQVKYGLYGPMGEYCVGHEIPLMRIEEMYLILAEAQGMSSNVPGGVQTLQDLIKNYRNPEYVCTASSAEELQDEVWHQRRIELWGEGLAFFDVMRLNKTIDRVGTNAADRFNYRIEPNDPVLIYCIPDIETNSNPQIKESDNNPSSASPTPIAQ